jgi:hypothetical protein
MEVGADIDASPIQTGPDIDASSIQTGPDIDASSIQTGADIDASPTQTGGDIDASCLREEDGTRDEEKNKPSESNDSVSKTKSVEPNRQTFDSGFGGFHDRAGPPIQYALWAAIPSRPGDGCPKGDFSLITYVIISNVNF